MFPGKCVVACHCGGTGDRGLFAPQSTCPGSSWRQGSHLPCTSTSPSVSAWLARIPQSAGWTGHSGWTARSTAGRLWRLEDSGEDPPAREVRPEREFTSGRPHPVPLAILLMYLLLPASVQWLHLGSGCRPTARTSSRRAWLALDQRPPGWNGSRPFRKQGQRTRWTPVKKCKVPCGINPARHCSREQCWSRDTTWRTCASHSSLSTSPRQHPPLSFTAQQSK